MRFHRGVVVGIFVLALGACPAPPTTVRFRLPTELAARAEALDAHPLFGDVAFVNAARISGAPDLAQWWALDTTSPAETEATLRALGATDISREPAFEPASITPTTWGARDDGPSCPIRTPQYDERQRYRAALHIDAAARLPGGTGRGVWVADVEGEWNTAHEDLPGARIRHVAGRRQGDGWRAHGTAVLGVLAAIDNGKGMLGLVPDVDRIFTASLGAIGAARAIYEAARALNPGDVLIVELHGPGPNADGRDPKNRQKGFVPMEYWPP